MTDTYKVIDNRWEGCTRLDGKDNQYVLDVQVLQNNYYTVHNYAFLNYEKKFNK